MSKVKTTIEEMKKEKMRHALRIKETARKKLQKKEAASGNRGYVLITEKPVYERYTNIIPEKREPIYEVRDRKGYTESTFVPGYYHTYYYTQKVKVGEKVTPKQQIRGRKFLGWEDLEKPYVQDIHYASKKSLKRAANKKLRHAKFKTVPNEGGGYKRMYEIKWAS